MSGNETAMTYLDNRAELTDSEQYVLSVLKVSLNGSEGENHVTFPEDAGCDDVLRMILRNGILLTVYDKLTPGLREKLQNRQLAALKQSITQDYEGKRVIEALAAAGMDCIALKGWELRTLYPDITMRQMADLDILVRPYNFLKIKSVMEKLGFSGEYETAWKHDSFKKSDVNVEVHKRLTDDSAAVRDWESGIWDRAVKTGEHIYKMTPEDFYIFRALYDARENSQIW